MIWDELQSELDALQRDGLKRRRRTLESPCGPQARVDGRTLISFCSNDYLGLANDPALVEAACAGASTWGVGSGASHLVSGHLARTRRWRRNSPLSPASRVRCSSPPATWPTWASFRRWSGAATRSSPTGSTTPR
jgi:hypothetical protein